MLEQSESFKNFDYVYKGKTFYSKNNQIDLNQELNQMNALVNRMLTESISQEAKYLFR
jgi:hypothetical protein